MISDLGYGAYFFFAAILVSMGVWAFFFVPETKGISLEEMDALFLRPMHRAVWAQLRGRPVLSEEQVVARTKGIDPMRDEKELDVERVKHIERR